MRISIPIVLSMLGVASAGCSSDAVDPYQQAAQEVASAAAALDQEGTDEAALDGIEGGDAAVGQDGDDDADEAAEEAARGDGGVRGGPHHGDGRGDHGRGRHPHGRRHGHGHGLLLWYADLDALQACRDVREQCLATATDEASCKDEVRACVQPVLEQAFAAMCEEKLAMCEADDASERHCAKIAEHCGGDDTDAGPAPETPDAG